MKTIFFKEENQKFFYKTNETWVETSFVCLGECIGKIVTDIVSKTYSSQLVNEIESNPQHQEFENYWIAVKNAHTIVHDDFIEFETAIKKQL